MLIYRYTRRNFEDEVHASRSSSPPVTTHHTATSNNDVISESSADEKSNEQPMLLTSIYQTFSGISSAPPATASSFQDPEPLPVSYVA
jgi:hypothetical protein